MVGETFACHVGTPARQWDVTGAWSSFLFPWGLSQQQKTEKTVVSTTKTFCIPKLATLFVPLVHLLMLLYRFLSLKGKWPAWTKKHKETPQGIMFQSHKMDSKVAHRWCSERVGRPGYFVGEGPTSKLRVELRFFDQLDMSLQEQKCREGDVALLREGLRALDSTSSSLQVQ